MARNQGRHRLSRRTKLATGAIGLSLALGATIVATTAGDPGRASADAADKSFFVDITTVQPNVKEANQSKNASKGTFTVDCGENQNGHFNPDNFIAQPGVKNGAQHLHDYVGNVSTNADSTNESLDAADTTCKNGDKSAYFWPVVRIDTGNEDGGGQDGANKSGDQNAKQVKADRATAQKTRQQAKVDCPDVVSKLDNVPDSAMPAVNEGLTELDQQTADANKEMAAADKQNNAEAKKAALNSVRDKRSASIKKIMDAMRAAGKQPGKLTNDAANCAVKDEKNNQNGVNDGSENSDGNDNAGDQLPGQDANNELPGNDGQILEPEKADLTFRGNAAGQVTAMPKFLRILFGDAKVSTNGPKNARPGFTCQGFEDRLIDKYPICPEGSKVLRVHDFPSCWDGENIDSANHRDHIVFPDENTGKCKQGFKAVPQLRITLTYNIPHDVQVNGQYKIDSFPEEEHNPASDHDDFANVMTQCIMNRVVNCINGGKTCSE